MPQLLNVPAHLSPFDVFQRLPQLAGSILLESVSANEELGKYSIIVTEPYATVRLIGGKTFVIKNGKGLLEKQEALEVVCTMLAEGNRVIDEDIPFSSGAVGYLSYDYGMELEQVTSGHVKNNSFPELFFGLYNWSLCYNHQLKEWNINGVCDRKGEIEKIITESRIESVSRKPQTYFLLSDMNRGEYVAAVIKAKEYIANGDIYQVNLSHRLWGKTGSSPLTIYHSLRENNPAPFSSFVRVDEKKVMMSSSPELFLSIEGKKIETRPIKGTIKRGKTEQDDEKLKKELLKSEKDAAELLMIVDLERNDLNKVCETLSVHVSSLKHIETYETVHHLVSIVRGTMRSDCDAIDALRALFPGGSITGAPKLRAIEIIDELEKSRRGVYTGAIGWLDSNGNAKFNIAIRTMMIEDESIWFNVGSGIVADSVPGQEYEETLHKADGLLRALNVSLKG